MATVWSSDIDKVLSVGHFLGASGIRNWALTKEQAIIAIDCLARLGIPILGGDVLTFADGVYRHNHDNWYCTQGEAESTSAFSNRSASESTGFINSYPAPLGLCWFAIVPEVQGPPCLSGDRNLEGFDDPGFAPER